MDHLLIAFIDLPMNETDNSVFLNGLMRRSITFFTYMSLLVFMFSCTYNNEEELYPAETCDTTIVTYHETIVPIISQRCYECHSVDAPVSGIPLEGYANIKAMVNAGRLIGAVRHLTGFSPMPKDRPSLPECELLKIEKWVAQGALDN